jgi:hypothetical protein
MCWLSWNLEASNSWNPQGLSRPVMGLLYLLIRGWVGPRWSGCYGEVPSFYQCIQWLFSYTTRKVYNVLNNNASYIVKYLCKHKFGSLIWWRLRFFFRALVSSLSQRGCINTLATQWTKCPLHTFVLYSVGVNTLSDTQMTSRWVCVSVCWHKNVWSLKQSPTFSEYTRIVPFVASPSSVAFSRRASASAEISRGSCRIRGQICKYRTLSPVQSTYNFFSSARYCLISDFSNIWGSQHRQTVRFQASTAK